jgi:hypothetical protein
VRRLRLLDFDLENRPLSYLGKDFTTADITAIAASFVGESKIHLWLIGLDGRWNVDEVGTMLEEFRALYDESDIVTGHFIRKHDLPYINWAMIELGLSELAPKRTQDTYLDSPPGHYASKGQENLAGMFGIKENKVHMTQHDWREANRLTPAGIEKVKARVVGDVKQHKALRAEMVKRDLLGPTKIWHP